MLFALLSGAIFGAGLVISGMTDPVRVIGFLDVFGNFDPRLIFVLGGAVLVTGTTFRFVARMSKPFAAPRFESSRVQTIDASLIVGSAIFGIGWGVAGFCPGPALAILSTGNAQAVWFVLAMLLGSIVQPVLARRASIENAVQPPPIK
ncbi:MAG: YeeE/YedE family protein [Steroidobacteraceae bacterium]